MATKATGAACAATAATAWLEEYPQNRQPTLPQIASFVDNPCWEELCEHVTRTYPVKQEIAYSRCSGAPGWNVKYHCKSRSLCTLYPQKGYFTCLVTVNQSAAAELECMLGAYTDTVQALYKASVPLNGSRWLMVDVKTRLVLKDVIALLQNKAKQF